MAAAVATNATEALAKINTIIAGNKIAVFSKSYCPYCVKVCEFPFSVDLFPRVLKWLCKFRWLRQQNCYNGCILEINEYFLILQVKDLFKQLSAEFFPVELDQLNGEYDREYYSVDMYDTL